MKKILFLNLTYPFPEAFLLHDLFAVAGPVSRHIFHLTSNHPFYIFSTPLLTCFLAIVQFLSYSTSHLVLATLTSFCLNHVLFNFSHIFSFWEQIADLEAEKSNSTQSLFQHLKNFEQFKCLKLRTTSYSVNDNNDGMYYCVLMTSAFLDVITS